jgi:hypothetical protein
MVCRVRHRRADRCANNTLDAVVPIDLAVYPGRRRLIFHHRAQRIRHLQRSRRCGPRDGSRHGTRAIRASTV